MHDVFVHPSGQDDNLGDSALRAGLLRALGTNRTRCHVHLDGQSSDYVAGIPLTERDVLYNSRRAWFDACRQTERPVYVLNAGEINPKPGRAFPGPRTVAEAHRVLERGGMVIATGLGLKHPSNATSVAFDRTLRDARVMSWRDGVSRDAAGFGEIAPDWAFSLGSASSTWSRMERREFVAVSLRFDRPWPGERWFMHVRSFAKDHTARIVTVAQVARDAPRAVQLANALGGDYLVPASTRHDDVDAHVRSIYARSLAVVSDRAHALIMGATEGAYPLGTATDPEKITRLLNTAGVGALTGDHDGFYDRSCRLSVELPRLRQSVDSARARLLRLVDRIHDAVDESV